MPAIICGLRQETLCGKLREHRGAKLGRIPACLRQLRRALPRVGHDGGQQRRTSLAPGALKGTLPRVVFAASRGVGQRPLQLDAVVKQGVVPAARVCPQFRRQHCAALDQRHQLTVAYPFDTREQLMQKDRAHIGLQIGRGHIVGKGQDAAGCSGPDAGQRAELLQVTGQLTAVALAQRLRGALQGQRATVVAQALPGREHVSYACGRQRVNRRKTLHPLLEVVRNTGGLSLLQHDLADQNGVGVTSLAPGKIAVQLRALRGNGADEIAQLHVAESRVRLRHL